MTRRGTLFLVAGPSGAGKDSIIAGAAQHFHDDARIVFAQRLITRPEEAGGEPHTAVTTKEFAALREAGGLMLYWQAHGFEYGLPLQLADELAAGRCVVANVSRSVIEEARRRFPPVIVTAIAASPETLAARLAGRGREDSADIAARLRRSDDIAPVRTDVVIDNDGPLDAAINRFAAMLTARLDQPASS